MDRAQGTRVGNRIIGAQSPVTVGWENIGKVEGGPVKKAFFTWFQPTVLIGLIVFWYYAPNSIATASTAIMIGIGFRLFLLGLEWVNPRHESWKLTWKELVTDLFFVGLGYTVLDTVEMYIGDDAIIEAVHNSFDWDKLQWFTGLPLLLQAFLISFIFDFGQYWMHRGMHNWYPLWLTHAPHHYITQLNINKGAVGNPVELAYQGSTISGRVRAVSPGVDAESRTGTLYVDLPEPGPLKAGVYLEGRIVTGSGQALMLPSEAVVQRDGHAYVFVLDDGQVVQRRRVRTGLAEAGRIEIVEGLEPGRRVVVKGAGFLGEGDRVRVVADTDTEAGAP